MAEIRVVFPREGEPFVLGYEETVKPLEPIYWHVSCFNEKVSKVLIRFEKATGKYFSTPSGLQGFFEKILKPVKYDRETGKTVRETLLWADAPGYSMHVTDKYSVIGLDQNGVEVPYAAVDPKIIVDGP